MKILFKIPIFLLLAANSLAQSPNTPPILFSSRFQITNAVNGTGDTIVISGYTDDCTTRFSNSDIAIGDSLYVLEGTDLLIFGVVTTRTISLGIATFKVRDFNGAGLLPSNGQAAIFRPTTDYDFPGYVCGLNDGLQQYISDRFRQNLDAALSAGSTDSTIYATVYSRDTAAAAIRGEIAALAQPPFDSTDIATGGIGNTDLAAGIVGTTKLTDDGVTLAKMASGTANRLIVYDGSGNPSEGTVSGILSLSSGDLAATEVDGDPANELETASQGLSKVSMDFRLGSTYMVNQPGEFSAARKMNWGNFSSFIGSDSDSTFFNIDLSGKKLALKSLLTTSADFFSLTSNDYKIFQVSHNGSMELRSGLYDARWFQFVNNATFTNYKLGIGPYTNVTGNGGIGIGYSTVVSGTDAIAIGNGAQATSTTALTVGYGSTATQTQAQSFGSYIANATTFSTVLGNGRNGTKTLGGISKYVGMGVYSEKPVANAGGYTASVLAGTWSRSNDTITWSGSMSVAPTAGQGYYFEQSPTVGSLAYVSVVISGTKFKIDRSITASSGTAIYAPESVGLFYVGDGFTTSSKTFFQIGRKGNLYAPDWVTNPSLYNGTVSKYVAMDATGKWFPTDAPALFYNVKTYGAIGDSTTNDYTAIQATIDAAELTGGIVYFPQGKYSFSSQLTVNKKNVTLMGAGKGASQLINRVSETTGTTAGIIIEGASGDTVENVVIKNLTIRGRSDNSDAPYSHVFVDDYARKTQFENVEFKWCRQYGLRYSASVEMPNTVVESCDFHDIATANMPKLGGAALSGVVSEMSVRNCNFMNVGDSLHYHAFYPDAQNPGNYDLLLENSTFRGTYSNFNLSSGDEEIIGSIKILGNTFASGSSTNIWKLSNPLIQGNVFYNNQCRVENDPRFIGNTFIDTLGTLTYFINDEGNTDNGTIKGNTFLGVSKNTVAIDIDGTGSARWDISGNTFRGMGLAIQVASDSNTIENNVVYSNHDTTSIDILSGADANIVKDNTIKSSNTVAIRNAGSSNSIICNEFFGGAAASANDPCVTTSVGNTTYWKLGGNTATDPTIGTNNTEPIHFETAGTRRLSIPSSGIANTPASTKALILSSNDSLQYKILQSDGFGNTVTQSGSDTLLNSALNYGHFQRVGDIVTFTVRIEIALVNTGAANTVYFDPPVASNFTAASTDVIGTASMDSQGLSSANTAHQRCLLFASDTDDKIGISFDPVASLSYPENRMYISASGSYIVQ